MRFSTADAGGRSFASPVLHAGITVQLGLATAASSMLGVGIAATGGWKVPAALLAGGALLMLGCVNPMLFLAVFVLGRPLVAAISGQQLVSGVSSANANGLTALLLIAVVVIMLGTRTVHPPRGTGAFAWILLVSAMAAAFAFGTLGGRVKADPITEMVRLTSMLSIYVLAANTFATVKRTRLLFRLIALSAVVPAIFGVVQWIQGPPFIPELGMARITSTLGGGPTTFAQYLAPCAVLLIYKDLTGLPRWIRFPSLALVLTALLGTYSREGWLMFLLGIVLLGWRHRRGVVLAVTAGVAVLIIAVPAVHDRVLPSTIKDPRATPAAGAYASLAWRLRNWGHLIDKYKESPVIGFGLGSEPYVNPYLDPYLPAGQGFPSHNSLLQILIQGGVVLLSPWLILFVVVLRSLVRMARAAWELRQFAATVLVLWVTVIVAGLITSDTLSTTTLMFIVLALTGSLQGAFRTAVLQARKVATA
jgi:O-antigen ligase